ncbi:radical SAM protein [Soehngenia longivitae]|uniref:Radical SAM protein n=1 Tax=Soehngenia longivitae TaxID=2562294 RepID=A0A4Z0D7B5_9FIRM|nr:radical SAM protein [Soehngenia longivitae]TFZ40766.1 radical SAM protein [Soehngenia longivitae]
MTSLKQFASNIAVNQVINYIDKNPKENLNKILNLSEKFLTNPRDIKVLYMLRNAVSNEDSNWKQLTDRFFEQTTLNCQKKFINNFLINSNIYGTQLRNEKKAELEISIPWAILMDPTSRCNLKCTGCWAASYDQKDDLSYETMNRIINEGKELGIYVYLFSGGEPFIKIDEILKLCEEHQDCYFTCFTNGTLITKEVAKKIAEVSNFAPGISIEGFEKDTDFRRGNGTYKKVLQGMDNLKEAGVIFGTSMCYHHYNYKEIVSEEFIDFLIDKGAYFVWLFTYMPIGKDADIDLCVRPDERAYMYRKVHALRNEKPIFLMDFWNDGEYVNGCIAGGRQYFHINAHGDVEPCAFVHYSDTNIKNVSLIEALNSNIFKAYQKRQPFNENHLRPCPILDNPNYIVEIVNESGAISTQPIDKEKPEELFEKCSIIADNWASVADDIWYDKKIKQNR